MISHYMRLISSLCNVWSLWCLDAKHQNPRKFVLLYWRLVSSPLFKGLGLVSDSEAFSLGLHTHPAEDVTPPSPSDTWDRLQRPPHPRPWCRSGGNVVVSGLHLYSTFLHSRSTRGAFQLPHIHPFVDTLADVMGGCCLTDQQRVRQVHWDQFMVWNLATRTLGNVWRRLDSNCRSVGR